MRAKLIFWLNLLCFSACVSIALAVIDLRDYELRGYVHAASDMDIPFRVNRLGVNVELLQYKTEMELRQHLTWLEQANVTWLRQFAYWDQIEPQNDQYQWDRWDFITATLDDYPQLRLVVVLMNTPTWARSSSIVTAPPTDYDEFAAFVSAFTRRYAQQVDHYQIWDEPNLDDNWGLNTPNPVEYAAMLASGYRAIHTADASALVIAAALAPTVEMSEQNSSDVSYLQDLYRIGANQYFDAVGAKPYGFNVSPLDRTVDLQTLNFSRMIMLREVMVAHGDARKPIWASAWGWNSLPVDWQGLPSIWGQVTQDRRSEYTLQALKRATDELPWLGGMILYHWQPDLPHDDARWGFALIDQYDQPTSLWHDLTMIATPQAAENGLYPATNPHARYSGLWTFGELGADIGWLETSDSVVEFTFSGTDLSLVLREGDYFGFLYASIDGQPAALLPTDSAGNAYTLLRSPTLQLQETIIPISEKLPPGQHTLKLIADRGWDQWSLIGFAVANTNPASAFQHLISMAIIASVISFLSLSHSISRLVPYRFSTVFARIYPPIEFILLVVASFCLMLSTWMTWGTGNPSLFRRESVEIPLLLLLTGGLLVFQLPFLGAIASLIVVFVLIYRNPHWGVMLVVFFSPFFLFPVELYRFAFPLSEIMLLVTALAVLVRILANLARADTPPKDLIGAFSGSINFLDGCLIGYLALGILAYSWSEFSDPALTELRVLFIEPALFYCILRYLRLPAQKLIYALCASALTIAVIGLILFIRGDAIITAEEGTLRLASVYGSPNNLALLLSRVIPFAICFALASRDRIRLFWLVALVVLLLTMALTQSSGGLFVALPIMLATLIILRWKRRSILPLFALALIFIFFLSVAAQLSPRVERLVSLNSTTAFMRIRVWESSLDMIADHPLTGLGLDQFLYEFRSHYIRPDAIADPDLSHPHNIILDFWIRLGLFGVVWLIVTVSGTLLTAARSLRSQLFNPVMAGSFVSFITLIGYGLIDNSIFLPDLIIIFVILLYVPFSTTAESIT